MSDHHGGYRRLRNISENLICIILCFHFSFAGTIVEKEWYTTNQHWAGIRIPQDFPRALP